MGGPRLGAFSFTRGVLEKLQDCYGPIETIEHQTDDESEKLRFKDSCGTLTYVNTTRIVCLVSHVCGIELESAHCVFMFYAVGSCALNASSSQRK